MRRWIAVLVAAGLRFAAAASGRRHTEVDLTEVHDDGEKNAVLRAFPRLVPHGVPFFVRLGLVTGADPEQFAAAAGRVAVFQVTDRPG